MSDERWMPKDLVVSRVVVELQMADVRTLPTGAPDFAPAAFDASATVLVGLDRSGVGLFRRFEARRNSVVEALDDLWAQARAAKL